VAFVSLSVLWGQSPDLQNELKAAAAAEQAGRYEEAAALYQRLLASSDLPKNTATGVHVRTRLATAYYLLHRYRESLDAVAPLTSKHSPQIQLPAQAWLVQGLDQLELERVSEATVSLKKTLALNPDSGTARLALGDALARSGRLEEAVRQYEEQTRRTASLPDAWYKLGLAYAQLATRVAHDFALKVPESIAGQQLLAEELFDKGDTSGAAGALFRLLRQAPDQPQAQAELGIVLFHLAYPKAAEERFRRELSYDPECPLARLGLAQAALLRGDWSEAISGMQELAHSHPRELGRLLELSPGGPLSDAWTEGKIPPPQRLAGLPWASVWKAWLNDSDSRPIPPDTETGRACSNPSSKALDTPGLWLSEACYERMRQRLRRKKALTLGARIKLAEAEFRLDNYQTARQEAKRVLESSAQNEWGIFWLSQSSGALAQDCFSKVASLSPKSARVHEMLAHYYVSRRQFARAKTEYAAGIRAAPELSDLHLGLGTLHLHDGELPEAEKELRRTLELAPGSAMAHYELGHIYVHQQRFDRAVEHLRAAMNDPALAVKARLGIAKAHAEMGQTRQAVEDLLPARESDKDGELHYRLAGLYRKLGEKAAAAEALATFQRLRNASVQAGRGDLEALEKERERFEDSNTPSKSR
jgi:tetratricopeptide (TPR) repeat protein